MKKAVAGILITVLVLGLGTTSALAADQAAAALPAEWADDSGYWRWGHMDLDGDGVCDFYGCDGADHWCPNGTWGCWGGHGGCGGLGRWDWSGGSGSRQVSYASGTQGYGYGCGRAWGGCHR